MYCKNCGTYMPEDALFCPACGAQVSDGVLQSNHKHRKKSAMFFAAIFIIVIVFVVSFFTLTHFLNAYQQQRYETALAEQKEEAAKTAEKEEKAEKAEKEQPKTTVINQYYYYGDDAVKGNDYYTESDNSGYLWPSDTEYISAADLRGLEKDTVAAIRNEIYARHGYAFSTDHWQEYFAKKTWYHRDATCNDSSIRMRLSSIERANISTIVSYEESRGWR